MPVMMDQTISTGRRGNGRRHLQEKGSTLMLGFRKNHHHPKNGSSADTAYQYRVDSRRSLLERYELVALRPDRNIDDERQRLARVLEEAAGDGWRLVGISGDDFVFRRRGNQPPR